MKKHLLYTISLISILTASCDSRNSTLTQEQETAKRHTDSFSAPATPPADTTATRTEIALMQNHLRNSLLKADLEFLTPEQRKFQYASYDLNADGKPEYLIALRNSYFCGSGGCTFYLVNKAGKLIGDFSVSDAPFIVAETRSNGWHDLLVPHQGKLRLLQFNGSAYPGNLPEAPVYAGTPAPALPRLLPENQDQHTHTF